MIDSVSDEELLATVRDLGAEREPDARARDLAAALAPGGQPDLRGDRDRNLAAPNPWRSA